MAGDANSIVAADITKSVEIDTLSSAVPLLNGNVQSVGNGHRMPAKMVTENDIDSVMKAPLNGAVLLLQQHCYRKRK